MSRISEKDEKLKIAITRVLKAASEPLKALDIARRISSSPEKKDVNRVLHNFMHGEAELANTTNPPLWRLSRATTSAGSCQPCSRASSSPGAANALTPSPNASSAATRAALGRSSSSSTVSPETYSKTEFLNGDIVFTPMRGTTSGSSSLQISPEQVSSGSAPIPQQANIDLPTGVTETGHYDPGVLLQPSNNTSVATVAIPLTGQQQKQKKKPKRNIAASFGGAVASEVTERGGMVMVEGNESCVPPEEKVIDQETESPAEGYVGQEMDHVDNEHVTQERSAQELADRIPSELADDFASIRLQ